MARTVQISVFVPDEGLTTHRCHAHVHAIHSNGRGEAFEFHPDHGLILYGPLTARHRDFCHARCRPVEPHAVAGLPDAIERRLGVKVADPAGAP